jgi:YegS/Rv2252/BmrU family lipid kinase
MKGVIPETVAIVNPAAGRKHGARVRPRVIAELQRLFPSLSVVETQGPGDATRIAQESLRMKLVIAVGGDGTVREVAAGLVAAKTGAETAPGPQLAVIPIGSGNDFPRNVGIPADIGEACRVARHGRPRLIDAVRVDVSAVDGERTLFYANAAGFGFDAMVVAEARKLTGLRGLPLYATAVYKAVNSFQCPLVRIAADGRVWEQRVLLVAAANGKRYGAGMKIAPEAEPDDGLLEVCIIDAVGRFKIMRCLPRLIAGTHVTMKEVTMLRLRDVVLEFLEPVMAQLDGDVVPIEGLPRFSIQVLPRALSILV